jgi:CubicO group peptidase (beta-lactamase class C family)
MRTSSNRSGKWLIAAPILTAVLFADSVALPEDLAPALAKHMASAAEKDNFSGSIVVTKNGQALLCEGYGFANREHEIRNTPQTKFRIGSVTKQFTAMAVMILQERGKLKVDDPVSKYLDDAPKAWDGITIHHLLSHTSGIPSYTGFPQMMSRTVRLQATVDEVIATFQDKPLEFSPGERFAYSNSGYHLLGKIIEKASGQDYETFLREAILQPLELKDTGYDQAATILPGRAAGYARTPKGLANAQYIDMSWPYAAGAIYSTVEDLARWDQALSAGKLVGPGSYQAMYTPVKQNYGYGWMIRDRSGRKEISHNGGIHGFSSSLVRYPDDKLCIVVLSNIIPAPTDRIAHELAAIVLGESAAEAKGAEKKSEPMCD